MGKTYDILEIKHQSLGLLLADFHICQHCHIVDRDRNRIRVGHTCANCGTPSPAGRMYFNLSVHSLINLMQEFIHKDQAKLETRDGELFNAIEELVTLGYYVKYK